MGNVYYREEIKKNIRERNEYVESICQFLEAEKADAKLKRRNFISPKKYMKNSATYRARFLKMLGFPLQRKREMPTLIEKTFVAQDKNVEIYRVQLGFSIGLKCYGIYFKQIQDSCSKPFILGLHGGAGTPELVSSIHMDSANYNHLVRRMTDRGANVFAPQLLLWSEQDYGGEYDRVIIDGKLRQLGGSITALELYMLQGWIDYFLEKESVNKDKIGVAGLSYGGMYAIHLAAIDPRIKACYSCSWLNDGFVHSWADWSYLNAQKTFTSVETSALICPHALVVAMGNKDELFNSELTKDVCREVAEYYRIYGAEKEFKSVIFEGSHELDKAEEELDFLFERLK